MDIRRSTFRVNARCLRAPRAARRYAALRPDGPSQVHVRPPFEQCVCCSFGAGSASALSFEARRSSTAAWAISTGFSTELMHMVIHKCRGIAYTFVERKSCGIFTHVVGCCCDVPGSVH